MCFLARHLLRPVGCVHTEPQRSLAAATLSTHNRHFFQHLVEITEEVVQRLVARRVLAGGGVFWRAAVCSRQAGNRGSKNSDSQGALRERTLGESRDRRFVFNPVAPGLLPMGATLEIIYNSISFGLNWF